MKTDALTKTIYVIGALMLIYIGYELFFNPQENWETGTYLLIAALVLVVGLITYYGNKISRKNKGL